MEPRNKLDQKFHNSNKQRAFLTLEQKAPGLSYRHICIVQITYGLTSAICPHSVTRYHSAARAYRTPASKKTTSTRTFLDICRSLTCRHRRLLFNLLLILSGKVIPANRTTDIFTHLSELLVPAMKLMLI